MNAARWRRAPVAHRAMLVGALTTAMFAGAWNVAQSQSEPTPAYPQADKHKPSTLAGPRRADVRGRPVELAVGHVAHGRHGQDGAGADRQVGRGP